MPGPRGKEGLDKIGEGLVLRMEHLERILGVTRIEPQDNGTEIVKGNGTGVVQDGITMSLPVETGASIAGRTKVGSSAVRVAGRGPEQVPRPGRIFRRADPGLKGTSVPGSEAMRDPGILAEWVDMAVMGATEGGLRVAVVTEGVEATLVAVVLEEVAVVLGVVAADIPEEVLSVRRGTPNS